MVLFTMGIVVWIIDKLLNIYRNVIKTNVSAASSFNNDVIPTSTTRSTTTENKQKLNEQIDEIEKNNQRQVIEIKTDEDFESALDLYYRKMRTDETHSEDHIRRWWKEEQEIDEKDRESREIFIAVKKKHIIRSILFATCPYDNYILNVYGFANRKYPKSNYDKVDLSFAITKELVNVLKIDLLKCRGMLIEVDSKTKRGKNKKKSPKIKLFNTILSRYGSELIKVPVSYRMPDLDGNCDSTKEKPMILLYAQIPWGKYNLNINNKSDVETMIHSMRSIYDDSFPRNPNWRRYLEDWDNSILNTYSPQGN
jgi:low affinity Fe/Cu permease